MQTLNRSIPELIYQIPRKCLQGEDQKKLDILANEVFLNMLAKSGQCAVVVSMLAPSHHCHMSCDHDAAHSQRNRKTSTLPSAIASSLA